MVQNVQAVQIVAGKDFGIGPWSFIDICELCALVVKFPIPVDLKNP
jgi:hypothetical protein